MATPSPDNSNNRINAYWERLAIFCMGVVLSLVVYAYQQQAQRIGALELNINRMDKLKIERVDLQETESRLNSKMDGMKTDLIARQDSGTAAILARIDLYFRK